MFNKIPCPTDGSDHAYKALDLAIDMAKQYDDELVILHVPHRPENIGPLRRSAEIEGLAPHVNTEIDRLRSINMHSDVLPRNLDFDQKLFSGEAFRRGLLGTA